jgi:hypothetical protein
MFVSHKWRFLLSLALLILALSGQIGAEGCGSGHAGGC